ncbi:hypothetical protein AUEXF2481DRAFT_305514 [Aureobasidium subglaciale EXF-2481]|uniref:Uncharacterized protein n=1 Tax=Aureobasidium subglaciale (strain EXF-2481) TaxID=1043005 RepID=A0A074YI82_AURSE|nr:uncharacterized protein AUEXF2481DRAFT_305514 [Aureobasidium subglaciale EXF-2481]KEQ93797.1 hypothetical protein AUEXF2481DRAFT_305514 [Aureobasidium subglaciale EXF-2481]
MLRPCCYLPEPIQNRVKAAFRNWWFLPPPLRTANTEANVLPGTWVAIKSPNEVMAVGSEGVIHLWCRIKPNTSKILERVIVKQLVWQCLRNDPTHRPRVQQLEAFIRTYAKFKGTKAGLARGARIPTQLKKYKIAQRRYDRLQIGRGGP